MNDMNDMNDMNGRENGRENDMNGRCLCFFSNFGNSFFPRDYVSVYVGLCNYGGLIDTLFTDVEGVA